MSDNLKDIGEKTFLKPTAFLLNKEIIFLCAILCRALECLQIRHFEIFLCVVLFQMLKKRFRFLFYFIKNWGHAKKTKLQVSSDCQIGFQWLFLVS